LCQETSGNPARLVADSVWTVSVEGNLLGTFDQNLKADRFAARKIASFEAGLPDFY
jgi:hypothetical protein